ncbi:MAG: phage tail protein, partial [Bacteroidia bacterium]
LIFPPEMGISERFEVAAARPSIKNEVKSIKYKGSTFKYKGPTTVEDMTIKFRDVVGPAVMQKLWQWQKEHYDFITGCGGYTSQYKKNLTLLIEDDCGNPVQKWVLYGCFIAGLDGGTLDMNSTGEPIELTLQIAYDYPEMSF